MNQIRSKFVNRPLIKVLVEQIYSIYGLIFKTFKKFFIIKIKYFFYNYKLTKSTLRSIPLTLASLITSFYFIKKDFKIKNLLLIKLSYLQAWVRLCSCQRSGLTPYVEPQRAFQQHQFCPQAFLRTLGYNWSLLHWWLPYLEPKNDLNLFILKLNK